MQVEQYLKELSVSKCKENENEAATLIDDIEHCVCEGLYRCKFTFFRE